MSRDSLLGRTRENKGYLHVSEDNKGCLNMSRQGSNLKKILGRLLATIDEKMVAKCKNAVAR